MRAATRLRGPSSSFRLDADGSPVYEYNNVIVPVDPDTPQTALHADPGFEDPTLTEWYDFWQVNGSISSSTDEAMAEERSLLVELSAAGSQAVMTSTPISVEAGEDVEFWVFAHKGTGSPTIRLDLLTRASGTPDYFDEPDTDQQTGVTQTLTGTYAKYKQTFTVPPGHTVARLSYVVEAPAAASAHLDSSGSQTSIVTSAGLMVPYTPVWTAASVNPVLGDGTLTGKWSQVRTTVNWQITLTIGASTTPGTGSWNLSLPTEPHADWTANMGGIGHGLAFDASAPAYNQLECGYFSGSVFLVSQAGVPLSSSAPWTWAVGDKVGVSGSYERAA